MTELAQMTSSPSSGDARPGSRLARLMARPCSLGLLLAAATWLAFYPVFRFQFVDLDDDLYVSANAHVLKGLTLEGADWALRTGHASNWHPLTWFSHMLDTQVFGPGPAGPHVVNVLFHLANTLLLFGVLRRLTGARWRSALVAALFALHPLHVESVAWISERKDVLSTFFLLLTLWAYGRYAEGRRKKEEGRMRNEETARGPHSSFIIHPSAFYVLSLVFFALGLMSKPMLVTLPFVLLLLDYWPLGRMQKEECRMQNGETDHAPRTTPHAPRITSPARRFLLPPSSFLLLEKLPFFLLAAVSSVVTYIVQHTGGAVMSAAELPFSGRIANALVGYCRYLGKLLWPVDLACFYPRPEHWPAGQVAGAALLLAVLTWLVLRQFSSRRYLPAGWFWFIGTLVPVIGLVQVGEQAIADRYTYIPSIGIFVLAAWGLGDMAARRPRLKPLLVSASIVALAVLLLATRQQVIHWQSSETLFRHALAVTKNNPWVHCLLADTLADAGHFEEAEAHCREALRLKPGFPEIEILYANILAQGNKPGEAIALLSKLLQHDSSDPATRFTLAALLARRGDTAQAIEHYQQGLRGQPDSPDALNNLAWIRATSANAAFRNGDEAVRLARRACELTGQRQPVMLGTLAAAWAEAGRFDEAIAAAQKARDLAQATGQDDLARKNQTLLELYQSHRPYHESPASPPPES